MNNLPPTLQPSCGTDTPKGKQRIATAGLRGSAPGAGFKKE